MPPPKRPKMVQVKLRIPEELKRKLDHEAKKRTDGSISGEIADRLMRSFNWPRFEKKLNDIADKLGKIVDRAKAYEDSQRDK
jgi:hypothetical protein